MGYAAKKNPNSRVNRDYPPVVVLAPQLGVDVQSKDLREGDKFRIGAKEFKVTRADD